MCWGQKDQCKKQSHSHIAKIRADTIQSTCVGYRLGSKSRGQREDGMLWSECLSLPANSYHEFFTPKAESISRWTLSFGFTGDSVIKNLPANAGDTGSVPGLGRSPGEGMATHSSILTWKSHGQRSVACCSPWDCKESDRLSNWSCKKQSEPSLELVMVTLALGRPSRCNHWCSLFTHCPGNG